MSRAAYKPKIVTVDGDKLWRHLHCNNCEKETSHIFCRLKYVRGEGYACFKCGQERDERLAQ